MNNTQHEQEVWGGGLNKHISDNTTVLMQPFEEHVTEHFRLKLSFEATLVPAECKANDDEVTKR